MTEPTIITITREDLTAGIYQPDTDPDIPKGEPACFDCSYLTDRPNKAIARIDTGFRGAPHRVHLICGPHLDQVFDWADDDPKWEPVAIEWLQP